MKKYLFLLLLVAVGTATYAQTPADSAGKSKKHSSTKKADQVEINSTSHQTVVEIKNDKIYVDGEMVSTIKNAKSEDHKIVINHKPKPHAKPAEGTVMAKKKRKPAPRKEKPETPAEAAADNSNAGTARTDLNSEATGHPFESMAPAGHEEHTGAHNALLGVYSANSGNPDGAYIARVISESPAASGGLAQGDVITKINETAINNSDELVATIGMYHPGDKVTVTYMRNGSTDQAQVTLGDKTMAEEQNEQPMYHNWEDNQDNNQDFNNNSNQNNSNQGMGNNNWNRYSYNQFRNYHKPVQLGISATDGRHPRGVYLDEVKAGSPAEIAGLQKGDIITRVAGERVRFAYEMQELLRMPGIGTVIDIDYRHDGQKMHTQVRVENNNRENRQYHHGYDDQRNYEDQRNY